MKESFCVNLSNGVCNFFGKFQTGYNIAFRRIRLILGTAQYVSIQRVSGTRVDCKIFSQGTVRNRDLIDWEKTRIIIGTLVTEPMTHVYLTLIRVIDFLFNFWQVRMRIGHPILQNNEAVFTSGEKRAEWRGNQFFYNNESSFMKPAICKTRSTLVNLSIHSITISKFPTGNLITCDSIKEFFSFFVKE